MDTQNQQFSRNNFRWLSIGVAALAGVLALAGPGLSQERPAAVPDKEEDQLNAGLGAPPAGVDRSTPRRAWVGFLGACKAGKWDMGAHYLNLGDIASDDQKVKGAALSRQLCQILEATAQVSAAGVDDTALGPMNEDKPRNYAVVATLEGPRGTVEVWLRRVTDKATGTTHWTVTRKTLSKLGVLFKALVKKEEVRVRDVAQTNPGLGPLPATLDLHSPRDAVATFVDLTREGSYQRAAHLLDLSAVPPRSQKSRGPKLVRRLAMVLKRIAPGAHLQLSNDSEGSPEKGVPVDQEVVAGTRVQGEEIEVRLLQYFRRGPAGAHTAVWLFSPTTVGQIDRLYEGLGYGWAGDYLPAVFFETELWGVQLWQWIGLLVALLVALIAGYAASYVTRKLLNKLAKFTAWRWDDAVVAAMRGPLVLVYWSLGFYVLATFLALDQQGDTVIWGLFKLVAVVSVGWFGVRVIDVLADTMLAFFRGREDDMGVAVVPVARKVLKTLAVAIALIVALQNVGMNVAGLLAGLGIGGLAIAMAAKTTLENLIGGITIAFDRPFKVGDYITVGDTSGTVEDLGLRSTRIRTLDRSLVTIPNGQVVDSKIENYAFRDKVRLVTTLGVQYDTTPEQITFIVDELKRYLLANPVVMDGFRVRFVGFGASSQDIEVVAYLDTSDFGEFTGFREQIYFDIGNIIAEAGAEFAFPSQTVYVGKDSHADAKKAKKAAQAVDERRGAGELTLPEIPEAVEQRLRKVKGEG